MLTERYRSALQFAATLHDTHLRKGTEIAYLSHLMSVSALVMENAGNETEAIAALLHDSIEDRGETYFSRFLVAPREGRSALKRDIQLLFGADVLSIVEHCTDDEYLPAGRAVKKGFAGRMEETQVGVSRQACKAERPGRAAGVLCGQVAQCARHPRRLRSPGRRAVVSIHRKDEAAATLVLPRTRETLHAAGQSPQGSGAHAAGTAVARCGRCDRWA